MDLKDIITVSGLTGLYKITGQRGNGVIAENLEGTDKRFLAARKFTITLLENITIYAEEGENIPLEEVLQNMKKEEVISKKIEASAPSDALKSYFKSVQPNYDGEKVYVSDIKKLIKWFQLLDSKGLIPKEVKKKEKEAKEGEEAEVKTKKTTAKKATATKAKPKPKPKTPNAGKRPAAPKGKPKPSQQMKKG